MTNTPAPPRGEEPTKRRQAATLASSSMGAASLVLDQHRTIADVARELGINDETLGTRIREGLASAEREELAHLDRQVKDLAMQRELAKRAMAYSVKGEGW